jgi:hypothetical protein
MGGFTLHIPKISYPQEVWNIEKNHFPQGGMLKFTYKGRFLTIKKTYKKLLY